MAFLLQLSPSTFVSRLCRKEKQAFPSFENGLPSFIDKNTALFLAHVWAAPLRCTHLYATFSLSWTLLPCSLQCAPRLDPSGNRPPFSYCRLLRHFSCHSCSNRTAWFSLSTPATRVTLADLDPHECLLCRPTLFLSAHSRLSSRMRSSLPSPMLTASSPSCVPYEKHDCFLALSFC